MNIIYIDHERILQDLSWLLYWVNCLVLYKKMTKSASYSLIIKFRILPVLNYLSKASLTSGIPQLQLWCKMSRIWHPNAWEWNMSRSTVRGNYLVSQAQAVYILLGLADYSVSEERYISSYVTWSFYWLNSYHNPAKIRDTTITQF